MDQRTLQIRAAIRSGNPSRALAVVEDLAPDDRQIALRRAESMVRNEMSLAHAPVKGCGGLAEPSGYERELGVLADLRLRSGS